MQFRDCPDCRGHRGRREVRRTVDQASPFVGNLKSAHWWATEQPGLSVIDIAIKDQDRLAVWSRRDRWHEVEIRCVGRVQERVNESYSLSGRSIWPPSHTPGT